MKKQIAILSALLVAMISLSLGAWSISKDQIIQNRQETLHAAMEAVLPGSTGFTPEEFVDTSGIIQGVWRSNLGYAIEMASHGYRDAIGLMVGVSSTGEILGLQVLEIHETPGLGQQSRYDQNFLSQFLHTRGDAVLGDSIDALSGATVTTKAFIKAVNGAAAYVTGADVSSGATEWGG